MPPSPAPAGLRTRLRHSLRALGHRDFRVFWAGLFVSLVGTRMQETALAWLVWKLTHSAQLLGMVGFAGNIAFLFLGLQAGGLVDRFDRRRMVLVAQSCQMILAFALAYLTWTGDVRVWHIMALSAAGGLLAVLEVPARQTLLMDLVGPADLMSAIVLNSAAFNLSRILGPVIAGLTLASLTEAGCFFANGLSYLGMVAALLVMGPALLAPGEATATRNGSGALEGLRHVMRHAEMRALLLLIVVMNLFAVPYHQLLPTYVDHVLGGGARTLGLFLAVFGIGALAGGLTAASREAASLSPVLAAQGALLYSASLLAFAAFPSVAAGIPLIVLMGFSAITQAATTNNYLQSRAPSELRGRVVALYTTSLIGTFPVGSLLMGWVAEQTGVRAAFALGSLVALTASLLLYPRLARASIARPAHPVRDAQPA